MLYVLGIISYKNVPIGIFEIYFLKLLTVLLLKDNTVYYLFILSFVFKFTPLCDLYNVLLCISFYIDIFIYTRVLHPKLKFFCKSFKFDNKTFFQYLNC